LKIVILLDEPSIEQLNVHVVVRFECRIPLPFAFEPDSVVVSAVPPLDVPPVVARTLASTRTWAVFEDVNEGVEAVLLIINGRRPATWRG
jgi:hypothetical protein